MRQLLISFAFGLLTMAPAMAEESPLKSLQTANDSRGWDAVGRLNLGTKGFCTGALIGPQLVLTAAHCLFDKETGARIGIEDLEFLAGWRNGRAAAYRGVRRAVAHPDYVYSGAEKLARVAFDLALIELDQPIQLPSIRPYITDALPAKGAEVGVVSYAQGRAEAPSLQQVCHVLGHQPDVLVLSCNVDFGSSGAPIFTIKDGVARVVSVVSAKAEIDGEQVALGTDLEGPLIALRAELAAQDAAGSRSIPSVRVLSGNQSGGAKFVKPGMRKTP